jgi:hypothetical protein
MTIKARVQRQKPFSERKLKMAQNYLTCNFVSGVNLQ